MILSQGSPGRHSLGTGDVSSPFGSFTLILLLPCEMDVFVDDIRKEDDTGCRREMRMADPGHDFLVEQPGEFHPGRGVVVHAVVFLCDDRSTNNPRDVTSFIAWRMIERVKACACRYLMLGESILFLQGGCGEFNDQFFQNKK